MKTSTILITPQVAENFLKKNTMNRPPSADVVNEYARQMAAGLWFEETGESIKVTAEGILIDGQQRLMAIIKSGVALRFLITEVTEDAFKYIDTGKKRTAADLFASSGVNNYTHIAAGLKRYTMLKRGMSIGYSQSPAGLIKAKISNSELFSLYCSQPDVYQGAHHNASSWYGKSGRLMQKSEIIGYYLFFRDIDIDDSFRFLDMLFVMNNVPHDSPIILLRSRLSEDRVNTRFKISGQVKTMLMLRTWNYYRKNETVKTLQINLNRDKMPVAI